jgi:hypothetical protein
MPLVALGLLGVSASPTLAQSAPAGTTLGACFEVIRAQAKSYRGAILLNRCNGDSWVLVRTHANDRQRLHPGSVAYRWQPIAMGRTETALPSVSRPNVQVPHIPKVRSKCFIFEGRQFCE